MGVADACMIRADGLVADSDGALMYPSLAVFDQSREYRYLLTRQWAAGPAAVFVMLNPSTADAFKLDPTVTRCRSFAAREGCGRLAVLNLFALRSTDPRVLAKHPAPVGPANDAALRQICTPGTLVIAAWGAWGRVHGRAREVERLLAGVEMRCLGQTKDGAPRHPLYVHGDAPLIPYMPSENAPHR